jgi:hypothetical protein
MPAGGETSLFQPRQNSRNWSPESVRHSVTGGASAASAVPNTNMAASVVIIFM